MRLVLMLLLTLGCTNDPTESSHVVRERYLDRHADTFTLSDRTRALDALRGVLAEEGFELVATDRSIHWKTDRKPGYKSTHELSIHILELLDGKFLLQIMELRRDEHGAVTEKQQRADLEWLVAQRSDPDRALALMKKANERADKVPPITRKK